MNVASLLLRAPSRGRATRFLFLLAGAFFFFDSSGGASAFSWQSGEWGVKVIANPNLGAAPIGVFLPGGDSVAGNELQIYRLRTAPDDWAQHWVFLAQGSWRQVAPGGEWGTSYHLLRYWSSADKPFDDPQAAAFQVGLLASTVTTSSIWL